MIRVHTKRKGKPLYSEVESVEADVKLLNFIQKKITDAIEAIAIFRQYRPLPILAGCPMSTKKILNGSEFGWLETLLKLQQEIVVFTTTYQNLWLNKATVREAMRYYRQGRKFFRETCSISTLIGSVLQQARYRERIKNGHADTTKNSPPDTLIGNPKKRKQK